MQQSRFFLHYALLNTRDCIRKIRGQDGPLLYREHTPAMKKLRQIADWRSGSHLKIPDKSGQNHD